jgi:putative Holliday junction resolvase
VALSDPLGVTAQPLRVIASKGAVKDMAAIGELVGMHGVTQVVVGLPLNMDGTDSTRTKKTRVFASKLAVRLNIPVVLVDERLTTWQAEEALKEAGVRGKNRRKNVDRIAASFILRSALEGAPLIPVKP